MIIKEYPKDTLVSDRKVGQCRKAIPLLLFLIYSLFFIILEPPQAAR